MNNLEDLVLELERYKQKYEKERTEKLNYELQWENCEKECAKLKNEVSSLEMVRAEIVRTNQDLQHEIDVLQTKLNSLYICESEEEKEEEINQNQDADLLNMYAWAQPKPQKSHAWKVVNRQSEGVWQNNSRKGYIASLQRYIVELDARIAFRKDQIDSATGDCKQAKGFYAKSIGELYQERRNVTNQISELKFQGHNPDGDRSDEIDLHELSCALAVEKVRPWLENVFQNRGQIITGKGRGKVNKAIVKLLRKNKNVHIESNNGTYICIVRK